MFRSIRYLASETLFISSKSLLRVSLSARGFAAILFEFAPAVIFTASARISYSLDKTLSAKALSDESLAEHLRSSNFWAKE